ncbi:SPOR domain-containing protein [Tepidicaulis sp. LMO-SS28]|uniref:SPOR domain-containing protein n=1 Tax=Tepidicaulis sp. LMO-SS28 TaxID=3447455 RepID=UPI003EE075C8
MSKKPASLTSGLLVKKGEALPSSLDPDARASAPEMTAAMAAASQEPPHAASGPDPNAQELGSGALGAQRPGQSPQGHDTPSSVLLSEEAEEMPKRPEPDVVMETDDPTANSDRTRRFVLGALIGGAILVVAGVGMSLLSGRDGSVAPLDPLTQGEEVAEAPGAGSQIMMDAEERAGAPVETAETDMAAATGEEPAPVRIMPIYSEETPAPEAADETAEAAPAETADSENTPGTRALEAAEQGPPAQAAAPEPEPAAPEPAPEPEPAQSAAAPADGVGTAQSGQYLVQLLSVRSEEAARGEWARLQGRYEELLGPHTINIQQADLGERGIYYRVRTGAFDTKGGADSFCGKLKAAGQDCLVRRAE